MLLLFSTVAATAPKKVLPRLEGAERFALPKVIDEIRPAKILNAGPGYYTYGLMGKDYRHDVVSLFADATPADAVRYHVDYVFVRESDAPRFQAALKIALLAEMKNSQGNVFAWRVIANANLTDQNGAGAIAQVLDSVRGRYLDDYTSRRPLR